MKKWLAIYLLWLGLVVTGIYYLTTLPRYQAPPIPANRDAKLWRRGEIMYKTRCTTCHNADPSKPGTVGPALRGVPEELIKERLSKGKSPMPAFPNLLWLTPSFYEYLR